MDSSNIEYIFLIFWRKDGIFSDKNIFCAETMREETIVKIKNFLD